MTDVNQDFLLSIYDDDVKNKIIEIIHLDLTDEEKIMKIIRYIEEKDHE